MHGRRESSFPKTQFDACYCMLLGLAAYGTHVKDKPTDFKWQKIKSSDLQDFKEASVANSS